MRRLTAIALIGWLLFNGSQPASAHAQLVGANPKAKAMVYVLPTQINLMFTDDLIDLPDSNQIQVVDPKGQRIDSGSVTLKGNQFGIGLKKSKLFGKYTVTYRVLSEDGHPVSASYWFTLAKKPVKTRG